MTKEEKFETIVKLFAQAMFYGKWKWETANERVITMLMQELELYPFKDEDTMIAKTSIDEELFMRSLTEVKREYKCADATTTKG